MTDIEVDLNLDNAINIDLELSGPSSAAIAGKVDENGGILVSDLNAGGNKIRNAADGILDTDLATVGQVPSLVEATDWVTGGAGDDLDWGVPLYDLTISQTWTPSLINPPEGAAQITIKLTMDGTNTIVWPPEIQWESSAPSLSSGEQVIVDILRGSTTEVFGKYSHENTVVVKKAPGEISGLIQHFDAHPDADSFVKLTSADYTAAAATLAAITQNGDLGRAKTWTAEVGGNLTVANNSGALLGLPIWEDAAGRRGLLSVSTGFGTDLRGGITTSGFWFAQSRATFPAMGSILTQHTFVFVMGPVPANAAAAGLPTGWGGSSTVLFTNDAANLADDYILSHNFADFAGQLGARWQEAGSGVTNRSISDQRDAPNFPDVYATRYNGTVWEWFRRSGRTPLDTYSQANIDIANRTWDLFMTSTGGLPGQGVFHEICVYNTAISDANLNSLMDHLAAKWEL